jgi:hypothetical protein
MDAADYFREQAAECRRRAPDATAALDRQGLRSLAKHYEQEAKRSTEQTRHYAVGSERSRSSQPPRYR